MNNTSGVRASEDFSGKKVIQKSSVFSLIFSRRPPVNIIKFLSKVCFHHVILSTCLPDFRCCKR